MAQLSNDARDKLIVAQYGALRDEIRGYQRDEVATLVPALAVIATFVTVSTFQSFVWLLALVPFVILIAWRKVAGTTANTFRTATFLSTYYESNPKESPLCWERGIEIFRAHREDIEKKLAWRRSNIHSIRWLFVLTACTALIVGGKSYVETARRIDDSALKYAELVVKFEETNAKITGKSSLPQTIWNVRDECLARARGEERWLHWLNGLGLVTVWVGCGVGLVITFGPGKSVGDDSWRRRDVDRWNKIMKGELTDPPGE